MGFNSSKHGFVKNSSVKASIFIWKWICIGNLYQKDGRSGKSLDMARQRKVCLAICATCLHLLFFLSTFSPGQK